MTDIVDIGPTGEIARFSGYGLTDVAGETVPTDGQPGFAPGCLFRKVNGTTGANTLYRNVGSKTSCDFDAVGGNGATVVANTISEFTAAAGVTIDGVLIKDTGIFNADLTLSSTNEINLMIGTASLLAIDDAAIVSNTATQNGLSAFIETQDGVAPAQGSGGTGGNFTLTAGIGGDTQDTDGGAAGTISLITQAGGAVVGGPGTAGNDGVIRLNAASGAGGVFFKQAAPATLNANGTLTAAKLLNGIVTSTSAAAVAATVDVGSLMDAAIHSQVGADEGFFWSLINTGPNTVTVTASSGHTLVGTATVVTLESGRFFTRRTAADTFVTYRVA